MNSPVATGSASNFPAQASRLKYGLLALCFYGFAALSMEQIRAFSRWNPHAAFHGADILAQAILLLAALVVANSLRHYLCPEGALPGLLASSSHLRIQRDQDLCTDCGECS